MPVVKCSVPQCTYETPDVDAAIIAQLLDLHKAAHPAPTPAPTPAGAAAAAEPREAKQRAPKIEPPKIYEGSSEETYVQTWHHFVGRRKSSTTFSMLQSIAR